MKTTTRTCATCASFNQNPTADQPLCWNLVSISADEVAAGAVCDEHLTHSEDAEETAMANAYHRIGCSWAVADYLRACQRARNVIQKAAGQ